MKSLKRKKIEKEKKSKRTRRRRKKKLFIKTGNPQMLQMQESRGESNNLILQEIKIMRKKKLLRFQMISDILLIHLHSM